MDAQGRRDGRDAGRRVDGLVGMHARRELQPDTDERHLSRVVTFPKSLDRE